MDFNKLFDTPDHTGEFDYNEVQNANVVVTALTYVIFFLPYICAPNSNYAKFHANQALIYLIAFVVLTLVSTIVCRVLGIIPLIGSFVASLVGIVVWLAKAGWFICGVVNALNKQAKELPIIGKYTILK
jgi:uncharacterized membrane protein